MHTRRKALELINELAIASELRRHLFLRNIQNIKALARYRGATAGTEYAEAFQLLKLIDK